MNVCWFCKDEDLWMGTNIIALNRYIYLCWDCAEKYKETLSKLRQLENQIIIIENEWLGLKENIEVEVIRE